MKKNSTPKNPLKIIDMLYSCPSSREEIIKALNIKPETFQKHLCLIRKAGIKVAQKKKIYYLNQYKNVINYMEVETGVLAYLIFLADSFLSVKKNSIISGALKNILLLSNDTCKKRVYRKYSFYKKMTFLTSNKEKISAIKNYIDRETTLRVVILKEKNELILIPQKVNWIDNQITVTFLDKTNKKEVVFPIEKILKVEPEENKRIFDRKNETIFELMGKLAKSYLLRDDERVVDFTKNSIVVASAQEDKELLFKRLLRYDVLCKVLVPKRDEESFKNLISLSLDNIEKLKTDEVLEGLN